MNDRTFLQIQAIQLRQLLEDAADDPILAPQLQQRLGEIERELRELPSGAKRLFPAEPASPPRVAIFLSGNSVQGSEGIRPSLAGEALIQYEKMFTAQAIHDERSAARAAGRQRRPRGAAIPSLWFTGTPRGSFGLELEPQTTDDTALLEVHARAIRNIADAISSVSDSSESFDRAMSHISPRVLPPLKRFLMALADHQAELRLAFSDAPSLSISHHEIRSAIERLDREWNFEELTIHGTFRGLTRESMVFDLLKDDGSVITGTMADSLSEDDLDRIDELTNLRCVADIQKMSIIRVGVSPRVTYLLLDARIADEDVDESAVSDSLGEPTPS